MSVYLRPGSTVYSYDLQIRGKRYSGSTGQTNKRAAEAEEKRIRAEKRAELAAEGNASRGMTWGEARDQYWLEVGQHWRGLGAKKMKPHLDWLDAAIGRDTPLRDIRNPTVAKIVAKRRGEPAKINRDTGEPIYPAPATVNRSCTEPLRRVLNRAREVWEEDVAPIRWRAHTLPEPKERVRELSPDEETELFKALRPDYHAIVRFALASGVRVGGCVALRWEDVDFSARTIRITGKGGRDYTIPMSWPMHAILWPLQGDHETAVFTYAAQQTRNGKERHKCYPITISGLATEWRRAGGPKDYRFHDNRHTRATRLLRQTGNLKLVQKLLGHTRIETTAKYAHASDDDLRNALDSETHGKSHAKDVTQGQVSAIKKQSGSG